NILLRQPIVIRDANGKLITLMLTVPEQYRLALQGALDKLQAVMPGELRNDNSKRDDYNFLSIHYSWYARYAQKVWSSVVYLVLLLILFSQGHTAPQDTHPDNLSKKNKGKCNITQQGPHQSKEILDNLKEYNLLAEAFTDIFEFLRVALEKYIPQDCCELSFYAEQLPLNASSPCFPFAGFVININVATWGH
ncbi:hypothetical protein C8R45DRAFT_797219, partial [Mycena sanguinolenta]